MNDIISNEFLDQKHRQSDIVLDRLVYAAAESLGDVKSITTMFKCISDTPRLTESELDRLLQENRITKEIAEFFLTNNAVPNLPWIDTAKLHAGGHFYRDRGVLGFISLACASLPACYSWGDVAYALGCTGRLARKNEVPRRLTETAMFVMDVATEHALRPGGVAIAASHKIRLMHAIIRYLVMTKQSIIRSGHDSPIEREEEASELTDTIFGHDWKNELGPPICQELLIGTLLTFSYVVLNGYRRMHVRVTDEEAEAYLHRWNVVGYFLGVDERVIANMRTMQDAEAMFELICQRNRQVTEDGPDLEGALLQYMHTNIIGRVIGGRANPVMLAPTILTRELAGRETCEAISLELSFWGKFFRYPVWLGVRAIGHLSNLRGVRLLTDAVMNYVARSLWDWRHIPEHRADSHGLAPRLESGGIGVHPALDKHWHLGR